MKFLGLNLLTSILLLTQGMLSHGQADQYYFEYSNGQTTKKVAIIEDQCIPVALDGGFHLKNVHLAAPMRCFNFADGECARMEFPHYVELRKGDNIAPPNTYGANICYLRSTFQ